MAGLLLLLQILGRAGLLLARPLPRGPRQNGQPRRAPSLKSDIDTSSWPRRSGSGVRRSDIAFVSVASGRLDFEIVAEVTGDGAVSDCAGDGDASPEYANLVCSSLKAEGWEILNDSAGNAVSYVTRLKARFTTERAQPS